tara:strand:+ start:676 stop:1608 length:933 start_codon:yes stop_codon:yes gene_type:complete
MRREDPLVRCGQWLLEKDLHTIGPSLVFIILPVFFIPLIGLCSSVVSIMVALLTLSKGAKKGLILLAWLVLPLLAVLYLHRLSVEYTLFANCVIIWLLASLLRAYRSWRLLLDTSVVIGFLLICLFHYLQPNLPQFWEGVWRAYFSSASSVSGMPISTEDINRTVQFLAPISTGLHFLNALITIFISMMIARYWQSLMYRPGAFQKELVQIRGDKLLLIGWLVVLSLGLYFKLGFLVDSTPLFLIPFAFVGLSVIHSYLLTKLKATQGVIILVYFVCLLFLSLAIMLFTVVGLLDLFLNFRQRMISVIKK